MIYNVYLALYFSFFFVSVIVVVDIVVGRLSGIEVEVLSWSRAQFFDSNVY